MKNNLIKKSAFFTLIFIYDLVSLLWCYIISSNFVYNLTVIQMNEPSIGIIGGADLPTFSFIMGGILRCTCSVLFVLLSLATVFLYTVSIIKKRSNRNFNVLLSIFLVLALIVYLLIPPQAYAISFYLIINKLSIIKHIQYVYIIVSVTSIAERIFFISRKGIAEQ